MSKAQCERTNRWDGVKFTDEAKRMLVLSLLPMLTVRVQNERLKLEAMKLSLQIEKLLQRIKLYAFKFE